MLSLADRIDVTLTANDIASRTPGTRNGRTPINRNGMITAWLVFECAPAAEPRIRTILDNRHRWAELGFADRAEAFRYLHAAGFLYAAGILP